MTEMIAEEQDQGLEAEVPKWLRSDVLDGEAREQAMDMLRRLTVHLKDKTTDMADSTMEEPIDNYLDPEVFASEVDLIFKRIPLPLALSAELANRLYLLRTLAADALRAMKQAGVTLPVHFVETSPVLREAQRDRDRQGG